MVGAVVVVIGNLLALIVALVDPRVKASWSDALLSKTSAIERASRRLAAVQRFHAPIGFAFLGVAHHRDPSRRLGGWHPWLAPFDSRRHRQLVNRMRRRRSRNWLSVPTQTLPGRDCALAGLRLAWDRILRTVGFIAAMLVNVVVGLRGGDAVAAIIRRLGRRQR